jgi:toxin ParE1/3/4
MRRVKFLPEAERELLAARDYYEMHSPGLGEQFLAKIEYTIGLIERYPESGGVLHDQVRRMATDKFPFHVVYTLEAETLLIVAIAHQRRLPWYWTGRGVVGPD